MTDAQREAWVAEATALVDTERLADVLAGMVGVASPTGGERPLAEDLTIELDRAGLEARLQLLTDRQANAAGCLGGDGSGPSLLLYAPIDTVTVGTEAEDLPWAGPELREDMRPDTHREGDLLWGLGAQNPKGHGACVLVAAEAVARAGVPLRGDLWVGFGAAGMPTDGGNGAGCARLLEEVVRPDHAVIAKSGWSVSWEEVGLAWYELQVHGTHTYVGSRHLLPYRNAIVDAGRVAADLDEWFETWADQHRSGLVAPQGVVSRIEAGWERMPAFTPAVARLLVDLRLSPRTTPDEATIAITEAVAAIARRHGADVEVRPLTAVPGTTTDPSAWIIGSAIRAWEAVTGRAHEPVAGLSGATDADILRGHGVPTARIGLPKVVLPDQEVDFQRGMNTVSLASMVDLTHALVRIAIDTCTRSIEEAAGG